MKRKIALLLSLMLLAAALFPVNVLAADDMGLTNAIKAAKAKLDIPEDYVFSRYSIYTENGRRIWNLEWNAEEGLGGYVIAAVDESGSIWNYYFHEYTDYSQRKLPKISRDEAKAIAESFIKKVNPGIASQLGFRDYYVPNLADSIYYFHYYRKVNDVEFSSNYAGVEVDRQTGKIRGFYAHWQDDLTFPDPQGNIGVEKAQEAYKEQLGLRLEYRYYMKDDEMTVYAVYAPKYSDLFIDAFTGEKVDLSYGRGYYDYVGGMGGMEFAANAQAKEAINIRLTPEEMEAVRKASGLMDRAALEKIAREEPALGLTDEYALQSENLYADWNDKNSFTMYFYFVREPVDKNDVYRSVEVSLNAKTGEIKSFYLYEPVEAGAVAKYDKDASKEAVEAFLKKFSPEKFNQTEYDDSSTNDFIPLAEGDNLPLEHSFRYIRKVGDAVFPSNSIYARYDAVNGKITAYSATWFDVEFPSLENVMDIEDVYARLFEEIGLGLQYKLDYSYEYFLRNGGQASKPEVRLVYDLNPGKPAVFDANTGVILDYNGQPYEEFKVPEYTDIAGSMFEEQIRILAENGIYLEGTEFRPDENIKQKDFFLMFSKVLGDYWYDSSTPEDQLLEYLYNLLEREGIIKDEEKAYDAYVTREDAVKFMIRALNYDEVADIKGIFICKFNDLDSINPDLTGYVAIASGLGIISGDTKGNFNPKRLLTRGETAALIYNYLAR